MSKPPILVIGAGLAGLSAARTLNKAGADFLVLEGEQEVGGLCRTESTGGFAFDYTGHLLHLRPGFARDLIMSELGDVLVEHERRASVYLDNTFVPYPIQANFGVLSPSLVDRCIDGYRRSREIQVSEDMTFPQWSNAQFGDGLAQLFMVPYNQKLYIHPLDEMEVSWTSWSVPRPSEEEMERAAMGYQSGIYGYNATFFYPKQGGIEILPGMLAEGLKDRILTSTRVEAVDAVNRVVTISGGKKISFSSIVSTMPLPELMRITSGLPSGFASAARKLRYSSVTALCLGFDRPAPREEHWVYFPEETVPFYRAGYFTNFSAELAPDGASSLYVEVAHRMDDQPRAGRLMEECLQGLRASGMLDPDSRLTASMSLSMPYAYVFYDGFRKKNLPSLLGALKERSVHSIGRYGAWEYSAMQDAIEQGAQTAGEILA
ncbi:FAD-binding protein [bacterium]|nr:MAG: FAD-binding protein [bacterium]